jgi:hypothetical protein
MSTRRAAWAAVAGVVGITSCAQIFGVDKNYELSGTGGTAGMPSSTTVTTSSTGGAGGMPSSTTLTTSGTGGTGGTSSSSGSSTSTSSSTTTSSSATTSSSTGDAGDGGCGQGLTACGNACVDEQTDPAHCGSCGNACDAPVSGATTGVPKCAGGGSCDVACNTTTPLDCAVTFGHACVNPQTDPQYCNGCSTHCPGGKTCQGGACVAACGPKLTSCSGSCVDLDSDPNHCGTCTTACGAITSYCNARSCVQALTGCGSLTSCSVGGGLAACADTMTDPTHCGNCTTVCGADQICSGGSCTSYIFASAGWECGNGNAFPTYCLSSGICVGTGVACP